MPRVYNSGPAVDKWHEDNDGQEGSSTLDVCSECYTDLSACPTEYNDKLKPYGDCEPQGEEGWIGEAEHPPYAEEDYECEMCGKTLGDDDD